KTTVPLVDDNFGAMHILLNVIHGWTRRVPRQLDIQILTQVASLIDKYELHETTEIFTDMWFEAVRPALLQDHHQNLASRVFICWILQKPSEFNILTRKAILETDCGLENDGAPIPYWITSDIQSRREDIFMKVFSMLSDMLDRYDGSEQLCCHDRNCDPLALGKLMRGLKRNRLYPIPEPSTMEMSIEKLLSTVRSIDLSSYCGNHSRKAGRRFHTWDEGQIEGSPHMDEEIKNSLSRIQGQIHGLELHD
ncbi:hypothetical protein BAUCODRAFT_51931, partial [Baudoinia panamericana UAMH 10762]